MLNNAQALDVANGILSASRAEDARLARVHQYIKGDYPSQVYIPTKALSQKAHEEYLAIIERSRVPVLSLPVDAMAQNLFVDGFRPARSADNAAGWARWQANRMDKRHGRLHRSAIGYGASYLSILPGTPVPVWRPMSARRCRAVYEDNLNDEWPLYSLEEWVLWSASGPVRQFRLLDAEASYRLTGSLAMAGAAEVVDRTVHDTGVCPVVRYTGPDLDDEHLGEVDPLIPLQDQLDSSTFNIEMAQQYAIHRQRWVTGMAVPEDDAGNAVEPFRAAIDRLWVAEDPDTRFGEFSQTDIKSWLDAREATMKHLAIKSQIPPGSVLGALINLSAEALAAAEAPQQRRGGEYKTSLGESHEQAFRLDALQAGDEAGWTDTSSQVVWRDTESRSLAQVADALGKLASQLGIPPRALWEKIPNVTDQDLETWDTMMREDQQRSADLAAASFGVGVVAGDAQPVEAAGAA